MVLVTNITYYMLLTYMPTYLSSNLGYSENHGVMIIIAVMIGMLFVQPLIGFTSDRIGRRPFILIGSIALFVVAIPAFLMIASNETAQIFLGLLLLAIALNCMIGVMAATLPALFPARIRYSALASSFNIAIIAAGLTPTLAAWLVASSNNLLMPAYYLMGAAVIGIVTSVFLPETANQPLRGDTPNASNPAEAQVLLQESYDIIEERIEDIDVEIATLQAKIAQLSAQREKLADRHPNID